MPDESRGENSTVEQTTVARGRKKRHRTTGELLRRGGRAFLVALAGREAGRIHAIEHEASVGRGEATIRLEDPAVSRVHCRIRLTESGDHRLEDLDSRNGVQVNGEWVRDVMLKSGDKVRLGHDSLFLFTERDEIEEQLLQAQKMQSLGRMAGSIAHDLNNIHGALLLSLNHLEALCQLGPVSADEVRDSLRDARLGLGRATELTDRLLGFAQPSRNRRQPVPVSDAVDEVVSMLRRSIGESVSLSTAVQANLVVVADPAQLHQLLLNLCLNALEAMPSGGALSVNCGSLEFTGKSDANQPLLQPGTYAALTVSDSGVGMDESVRSRAFEPFFTTKREAGGTGLGLATAYQVVEGHGGQIQITSSPGRGTLVRVLLPAL